MVYNGNILFNSVPLYLTKVSPMKRKKTIKQKIGKSLGQLNVIGMDAQEYILDCSGKVYGTTDANLTTNRANIEALDDNNSYAFVDGIHDGSYIVVPSSLKFEDSGETIGYYDYSFTLVQE